MTVSCCKRCLTSAGCVVHKRFTCVTCGRLTHWRDGADDDRPNDCSDCWAQWFGAMELVAHGLFTLLGVT